jgi:Ca2+-binding EF-hand superfamily protein
VMERSISMVSLGPLGEYTWKSHPTIRRANKIATEFIAMMTGRSRHSAPEPTPAEAPANVAEGDSEADYQAAWKEFDPSLKGSITTAQFRQLMAGLGENVSDVEVDELINSVDGEDKISCKLVCVVGV